MQETRRAVLDALGEQSLSGPALAERLDCSRTAVWKHVEALRSAGFVIESSDRGYTLVEIPEFGGMAVEYGLTAPYTVEYHDSIDSTNARARERAQDGDRNVVVLADRQRGGRGRLDRTWASPSGGIWLSVVLDADQPPAEAPIYTLAAAVAVVRAVQSVGVDATIKWPNDVIVSTADGERKLAGILTEMAGEHDRIDWLVIGIGLNANIEQPKLPPGGTSIQSIVGPVDRRELTQSLLEHLSALCETPEDIIDAWREHARTLGQRVRVETHSETLVGRAVDIEFPGTLCVELDDGEQRRITAGDCEHLRPAE